MCILFEVPITLFSMYYYIGTRSVYILELVLRINYIIIKQRQAFSVIGPSTWNELPLTLYLLFQNNVSSFCKLLNTFLFVRNWTESASE